MSSNGGISGSTSVAAVGWGSSCFGVVKGVDDEADGVDGVVDVVDGVTFAASHAVFSTLVSFCPGSYHFPVRPTYCYIVGLGLNCKFIDLLFKHSFIKFIKISSHLDFIVSEIIYNQTDTLTQRLIDLR